MAESKIPPDIAKLSFEDALDELQALVRTLEKGESKLDQAVQAYERGVALKRHCEVKLREAQAKVDKIVLGAEGAVSAEPRRSPWRVAQFDTLRLRLIKDAAHVVELATRIKVHLPSACPDKVIIFHLARA